MNKTIKVENPLSIAHIPPLSRIMFTFEVRKRLTFARNDGSSVYAPHSYTDDSLSPTETSSAGFLCTLPLKGAVQLTHEHVALEKL